MIESRDFHFQAIRLLLPRDVPEADVRRAISALYYGLFHLLTTEGASVFHDGGAALEKQAARAFSHAAMRKVCEAYTRSPERPFPPPLDRLAPIVPDRRLVQVADIFVKLQEARHAADYDLAATFTRSEGIDFLQLAEFARWKMEELRGRPDVAVFLGALLLSDRWTRRG